MRFAALLLLSAGTLHAQFCAPARLLPAGSTPGILGDASCRLSDGSLYGAYRLDLAGRGKMSIDLSAGDGFSLILRDASGQALDTGAAIHRPLEAGAYTLIVNGPPGGYSVQTGFTPERGTLCSAFPSAGLSQTVAGMLGASGCVTPEGSSFEAYTVTTLGSGTLTVSPVSADFP